MYRFYMGLIKPNENTIIYIQCQPVIWKLIGICCSAEFQVLLVQIEIKVYMRARGKEQ